MKNYPLNPFVDKFVNWTATYLTELNSKIWSLKHYSDFFLTNYTQIDLEYETFSVRDTEDHDLDISIVTVEILDFHNYGYVVKDCFIRTDASDTDAVTYFTISYDGDTEIKTPIYVRPIAAGSTIISNARPEGSINANGILKYYLHIFNWEDDDPEDSDDPIWTEWELADNENDALGYNLPSYGPPHPDRSNWKNFIIQPTGFASLYTIEPIENGLKFIFQEKGGENFGTDLSLLLLFQNARYHYRSNGSITNISFTSQKFGMELYAKDSNSNALIATILGNNEDSNDEDSVQTLAPWIAYSNPLMTFLYLNRDISDTDNPVYGEEVIMDWSFEVRSTKLETVNTLEYDINTNSDQAPTGSDVIIAEIV